MSQTASIPNQQKNLSSSFDMSQNQQNLYNNSQSLSINSPNVNISSTLKRPEISIKIEDENQKSSTNPKLIAAANNIINIKSYLKSEACQRNPALPYCSYIKKNIKKPPSELKNPLLINQCKKAIARERKELPNYKEIIEKINTEFGIEDNKNFLNELDVRTDEGYKKRDNGSNYYENEKNSVNSIIYEQGSMSSGIDGGIQQPKMGLHLRDNSMTSINNNSSQMTKETQM